MNEVRTAALSRLNHDDVGLAAEEICKVLTDQSWARLNNKIKTFPCHSNRASEIGHPCHAYLYYCRENWQDREKHSATLQSIFDEGHMHESHVQQEILRDCNELGWAFVGQQQDFHDKELEITGHVDGIIMISDPMTNASKKFPVEIKTMSDNIWQRIDTVKDLINAKYPHLQKYYGQMQAYLYLNASEAGVFVLKNKTTGLRKYIPCPFDFDYTDTMIKRVQAVNVARGTTSIPERILKDEYCENCAFRKICIGEKLTSVEAYDNDRLKSALEMREAASEGKKQYEEAMEIIKEEAAKAGKEEFKVGGWLIKRTYYEEKTKTFTQKPYWTNRIIRT